jgi:hypothetical protein
MLTNREALIREAVRRAELLDATVEGPPGPKGDPGEQGPQGTPGAGLSITGTGYPHVTAGAVDAAAVASIPEADVTNLVTDLANLLTSVNVKVDTATFNNHKARHQSGGADQINVGGLSGQLADPQPPIIGATAATAVAGNDARLTNARTPTAHAATHQPGGGDAMAVDAAAATGSLRTLGSGAQQAAAGNDSRFTDSRTPTAHALESAGGFHTASGLTTGWVLRATGATTFAIQALQAADIPNLAASKITSGQLELAQGGTGVDGSTGNLANRVFASPDGASGALGVRSLVAADIPSLDAAKIGTGTFATARIPGHEIQSSGGFQTASGLTTGWVLRATGATSFAFQAIQAGDIPRLTGANMLDGTLGFTLVGQGSGVSPVYASRITTRLTADNTAIAAGTTPAQVANLTQAVGINEEWDVEWILDLIFSVATDVAILSVSVAAGTFTGQVMIEGQNGVPDTGAGVDKLISIAPGTALAASANCPGNTGSTTKKTTVIVRARGKQTTSASTLSVNARAVTSGGLTSGTLTVKAQSQMISRRIA